MFQTIQRKLGSLKKAQKDYDSLVAKVASYERFVPPGHFYSPIPLLTEVVADSPRIFARPSKELPNIDLNENGQLALLDELSAYYAEMPFTESKSSEMRYHFENPFYSYGDATILYSMLRHFRPRRYIEIGSGYSSAVVLDVNHQFLGGEVQCTFIEPYPNHLNNLLRPDDLARVTILQSRLQDVDASVFATLHSGDFLFIDSTHVSKCGSDVNRIFFEILSALPKGVIIHIHDVFYPFEYPQAWVMEGRAWNELYVLRAFLQFNSAFKIRFFNQFLGTFHAERWQSKMPLCAKNFGGALWLEKTA